MVFRNRFLPVLIAALLGPCAPALGASHHHDSTPAGPPVVTVRAGDHKGLSRLLVSWRKIVGFVIDEEPGTVTVIFDQPAKADLGNTPTQHLRDIQSVAVTDDPQKLILRLGVKPGAKSRAFRAGNMVIVDILDSPEGEAAPPAAATADKTDKAKIEAKTAAAAAAETPPASDETILHLQLEQPASLAAFRRGDYLWLVTDGKFSAPSPTISGPLAANLGQPTRYSAQSATLLRYRVKAEAPAQADGKSETVISTRQHGGGWDVVLSSHPQPASTLAIKAVAAQNAVSITAPGTTQVIGFTDPDLGDTMNIVALPTAGEFIAKSRHFPNADLLQTAQGVVAITHGDRTAVMGALGEITISGMDLSADSGLHGTAPALFDLAAWYLGGSANLIHNRREIEHAAIQDQDSGEREPAIELARLFLANGYGNEAMGALKLAAGIEPDLVSSPDFLALRGGAEALMARADEASADLSVDALQNQPEAALWRALGETYGTPDQRQEAFSILRSDVKTIEKYPPELKRRFALALAALAVENNESSSMEAALGLLTKGDQPDISADAAIASLKAGMAFERGKFAEADKLYASVPGYSDQFWTAQSGFAAVKNGLAMTTLSQKDAIAKLDGLRYGWRGDDYEFRVLAELGDLYFATGDYKNGLDTMRTLIAAADGTPFAENARAKVIDTAKLAFGPEATSKSSPLDTFALYNAFVPYLPPHTIADEDLRNLSGRLAAIGVMDQAVSLIEPQMNEASDPVLKAKLGERIAALRLLDDKPDLALKALADSNSDKLDAAEKSDRKLLEARALFKSGKSDEAVTTLAAETSREADALRVEIAWPRHDWKNAAVALNRLAGTPGTGNTLTPEQANIVLNEAVALNLGNDPASLEQLRKTFAAAMAKTKNASAFALLTSPNSDMRAPSLDAVKASVSSLGIFENFLSSYRKEPGKA